MTIARLIADRTREIMRCAPDEGVEQAARKLAENRIGALPVLDGQIVVGIFSERDLLYCIARDGPDALRLRVTQVMTAPAISVTPETTALEALSLMTRRRIRHLPVVVEGDRLIEFVSIGDLVKYRIDLIEHEAEAMRDYIRMA